MGWTTEQKRIFAKEIVNVDFERGAALKYLTGRMRSAIVDAHCFGVARQQSAGVVTVDDLDDLRDGVRAAIIARLGVGVFE